jgi:hypothetical protein
MKVFKYLNAVVVVVFFCLAMQTIWDQSFIMSFLMYLFLLGVFQMLSGLILFAAGKKPFGKYLLIGIACCGLISVGSFTGGAYEETQFFVFLVLLPFAVAAYFTYLCFSVK